MRYNKKEQNGDTNEKDYGPSAYSDPLSHYSRELQHAQAREQLEG